MSNRNQVRTYTRSESVVFRKTNEPFGGLSNMAGGYPIRVNGVSVRTSEALYQACRFPHLPDVQRMIIGEISPMTAKMRSRPYRKTSRSDWDRVRVRIMRWCLRMKLANNWDEFSELLLQTEDRPIVEESCKDDFWGAKPIGDGSKLIGMNVLGRLLMELREQVREHGRDAFLNVAPPDVANFLLLGQPIGTWVITAEHQESNGAPKQQNDLFGGLPEKPSGVEIRRVAERGLGGGGAMKIRSYPEYKDSGVPWLGKVPSHWQVKPNRALFEEIRDQNYPDEELLSVTINKGVIRQKDLLSETSKKDSSNLDKTKYKLVTPGDIVYNKMRAWQGAIGLSRYRGIVSPAYIVERPRKEILSSFSHYLFRTPRFAKEAERWSYGITSDQWSLRPEHFKAIYSCVPSKKEQTQIARFLDWKTAQIDRFIRNKRRLIELLKEQKQALINQAVTGAIDVRTGKPYPEYKDSGVPWLGKVPVGWEVRPLKHAVRINTDVLPESTPPDFQFRYVEISDVGTGELVNEPETVTFGKAPSRARRRIEPGDTIISTVRTYLKAVLHITEELEGVIVSTGFAVLRPKSGIHQEFLGYLLQADAFINQVIAESIGVSYPAIAETRLGRLKVAYPTDIEEQEKIVSYIEQKSTPLMGAITRTQHEINLMREYRTRLIADVVTGKLDVRGVIVPSFEKPTQGDTDTNETEIPACDQEAMA